MNSKINKGSKPKSKKTTKKGNKVPAIVGLAGLAGLAGLGLGIKRLMKKNNSNWDLQMEPVNEEKKLQYYTAIESNKDFKALQKTITKEQEANKQLVDHINRCNKEVLRLQGLVSKKESLHKEAMLRSTIKKLQKK